MSRGKFCFSSVNFFVARIRRKNDNQEKLQNSNFRITIHIQIIFTTIDFLKTIKDFSRHC